MVRHSTTRGPHQHCDAPEMIGNEKVSRTDVADLQTFVCHVGQVGGQGSSADGSRMVGGRREELVNRPMGNFLVYTRPPLGLRGGLCQKAAPSVICPRVLLKPPEFPIKRKNMTNDHELTI